MDSNNIELTNILDRLSGVDSQAAAVVNEYRSLYGTPLPYMEMSTWVHRLMRGRLSPSDRLPNKPAFDVLEDALKNASASTPYGEQILNLIYVGFFEAILSDCNFDQELLEPVLISLPNDISRRLKSYLVTINQQADSPKSTRSG